MRPTTCDRGGVSVVAKLCVRQGTVLCDRGRFSVVAKFYLRMLHILWQKWCLVAAWNFEF